MPWRFLIILSLVCQPALAWGGTLAPSCGDQPRPAAHRDTEQNTVCCPLTAADSGCPCGCACGPAEDRPPHEEPRAPSRDAPSLSGILFKAPALPGLLPRSDMAPAANAGLTAPARGRVPAQALLCIWQT